MRLLDILCDLTSGQRKLMALQDHPDLLQTTIGKYIVAGQLTGLVFILATLPTPIGILKLHNGKKKNNNTYMHSVIFSHSKCALIT